jgi:outer membrane protein assembly factor BamB
MPAGVVVLGALAQAPGTPATLTLMGGNPNRNLVNGVDKNIAVEWSGEEGKFKNIKWVAAIGSRGYGCPIVAGGRVFVNTNNQVPRDKKITGDKAVVMCFREKDGSFLWQAVHDMAPPPVDQQAVKDGLCSTPAVEGDRLYYVTPGCQVICAKTENGDMVWNYDMMKELKVFPCIINSCSPLLVGDTVFVMTGNGINEDGQVQAAKAPSFVALEKKTGKLKWQSNLPGTNILHGQWGNPAFAEVNGKGQVIFPGGDGWLYSLEPDTGNLIWKFECNPLKSNAKAADRAKRNYLVSTPVVHGKHVYVGIGNAPETGFGNREGHFWCIDITKTGDVSAAKDDYGPKSPANKNSALVWHFGGAAETKTKGGRTVAFGPTLSMCVVHDGLLYVGEEAGYFYCLDADTGKKHWEHDFKSAIWGSPSCVDGKIYQGVEDGVVYVLGQSKTKNLLHENDMGEAVQSTPVAANGVLYVVTKSKLFAISNPK